MKINRKALLGALVAVSPGLSDKALDKQSDCFVFSDGQVFTCNNEIAISHPIDVGFEGAIKAKEFKGLISKVKSVDVDLVLKGGEVTLAASKAKSGLRVMTEITMPIDDIAIPSDDDWIGLPSPFNKAVKTCIFSASTDGSTAILTNVHVKGRLVESCDNYRMTRYDMGDLAEPCFPDSILIPVSSASAIVSNEPTSYGVTPGWLHFENDEGVVFSCRCMNAKYPDLTPLAVIDSKTSLVLPETIGEILDRAETFSDGQRVTVILEEDFVTLVSENENGWFEESSEAKYDGDPVEFDINPKFLKSIIKHKGKIGADSTRLKFESGNFVHVVRLLTPKAKK